MTAGVLDGLFAGAGVRDRRVSDNYSVSLTTDSAGPARGLNLLLRGSRQLVRSRSAARVVRALLFHLSAELTEPDRSLQRAHAVVALRGDDALLLPPAVAGWLKELQPRLARAGVALADVPCATLDLPAGELVVPEPAIPYEASVLAGLDGGARSGSELPAVLPGRYPLRAWLLVRSPEAVGPLTPAVGAVTALSLLHDVPDVAPDLREAVEQLAACFTRATPHGVWYQSPDELVAQVVAALAAP